jgi:hypothetical protein
LFRWVERERKFVCPNPSDLTELPALATREAQQCRNRTQTS